MQTEAQLRLRSPGQGPPKTAGQLSRGKPVRAPEETADLDTQGHQEPGGTLEQ